MTRTRDVSIAGRTISMCRIAEFAPIVVFHKNERYFPCSIEHLLTNSTLRSTEDPTFAILNPTTDDLALYCGSCYFVDIAECQYSGHPLAGNRVNAPMYVSVQFSDHYADITYAFLYAFQGGQTFSALRSCAPFDCVVNNYGQHQGDLEWITVRVSLDFSQILGVGYAAHGVVKMYEPREFSAEGSHPIVKCALHSHASRNVSDCEAELVFTYKVPHVFAAADMVSHKGVQWRPHETNDFVLLGLDDRGEPVNEHKWVKFHGRLGRSWHNARCHEVYLDGTPLNFWDKLYVCCLANIATWFKLIPEKDLEGNAPKGFGGRHWVWATEEKGRHIPVETPRARPALPFSTQHL